MENMMRKGELKRMGTRDDDLGVTARAMRSTIKQLSKSLKVGRPSEALVAEQEAYYYSSGMDRASWLLDLTELDCKCQRRETEMHIWEDTPFKLAVGGWRRAAAINSAIKDSQEDIKPKLKHLALFSATGNFTQAAGTNPKTGESLSDPHIVFILEKSSSTSSEGFIKPVFGAQTIDYYSAFQILFRREIASELAKRVVKAGSAERSRRDRWETNGERRDKLETTAVRSTERWEAVLGERPDQLQKSEERSRFSRSSNRSGTSTGYDEIWEANAVLGERPDQLQKSEERSPRENRSSNGHGSGTSTGYDERWEANAVIGEWPDQLQKSEERSPRKNRSSNGSGTSTGYDERWEANAVFGEWPDQLQKSEERSPRKNRSNNRAEAPGSSHLRSMRHYS